MRSSVDGLPSHNGRGTTGNSTNNNNNSSTNTGNSGSQYALCALGVGLVALGIVMIVWSVVPTNVASNNNNSSSGGDQDQTGKKNKASSVAFVLVGSGVAVLLLSMCLGLRNRHREQQHLRLQQAQSNQTATEQATTDLAEEQVQQYDVPSYEEAVGSGQYPVRQSNLRPSVSQLPSYDDLVQVDGLQYESEGAVDGQQPASASNRRLSKNACKLLPIKIRRIKSEKLHIKNSDISQTPPETSIEPLTPPPQYEDKLPPL